MFKPIVIVKNKQVPGLVKLTPGPEPQFGDGTGRNTMDGHFSGTFVGYFTTLQLDFGRVSDSDFNLIKTLLEHPFLDGVKYQLEKDLGPYKQGDWFIEDFYNGAAIKSSPTTEGGYWEPFSVTLTAIDGRPDNE